MGAFVSQGSLGSLSRVSLRDIWQTEDRHFTPWLAQEENIAILGEALGLELEVEAQERSVGPFRADILCKDLDNNWILIENQLERTDHTHLGQLMTYASGLKAVTIVWIAERFTEEHRAALDWLNQITDDSFRFFGLEIELWRIGDSAAAPKFNIVAQPNQWSKTVGQASRRIQSEAVTETKQLQLAFWEKLHTRLESHQVLRTQKPRPQHWASLPIGRSGIMLMASIDSRKELVGVELYLADDDATAFFHLLKADQRAIEQELGFSPEWLLLPERRACRIIQQRSGAPLED
ncbi:MAG: DUF4268 domain-containing protein [Pseudomonadota bacterium]